MSYKLKSIRALENGYYRAAFEPTSKEFIVDIPQSELDTFFGELSDLELNKPFDVQIRKRQTFEERYNESYEMRFGYSDTFIKNVIPVE